MGDPLVSVKTITYNQAPYIRRAIEGVLRQKTDFPFELVIGEDCSTDGTREIVFEYQEKYPDVIRVVTSDKNVGMKKNSLRTTRACRGDYVAFCEGDDYWHSPHKLQKQADYMQAHPDCGLVYSSFDVLHPASGREIKDYIKYRKWTMPENLSVRDFLEGRDEVGFGILTCTVIVRRALYLRIIEADATLHQSDRFLMGDTQLWAEFANLAKVHFIPESLATHVLSDESATRSKDVRKVLRFSISGAELSLYLSEKYNVPGEIRRKHVEQWCNASLRLAFETMNAGLAEEVRKRKNGFTWIEWLRYYGARNRPIHYFYRAGARAAKLAKREQPLLWLRDPEVFR